MVGEKIVFVNVYSGTTFTVIGDEAAERMDRLASWERWDAGTYGDWRDRGFAGA